MATKKIENKKVFTVKVEKDGKEEELKLAVLRPSNKAKQEAQYHYAKVFREAVTRGAVLRAKVKQVMKEQLLWDEAKQAKWEELTKFLADGGHKLKGGGGSFEDAKTLAHEMRKKRSELYELNADENTLDQNTAEALAEQARFDMLMVHCVIHADSGKKHYKDLDDYQNREEDPVAAAAGPMLSRMEYGLDEGWQKSFAENEFFIKHGLMNDKLQLLNADGHPVDEDGRLINDRGWYVDEQGNRVDRDGRRLDEAGEYIYSFQPFLDKDGNPIAASANGHTDSPAVPPSPLELIQNP